MMIHHGTESYEVAASKAAKVQTAKLEELIHKGRESAESVITQIMESQPVDRIVPGRVIEWVQDEGGRIALSNRKQPGAAPIHDHALQQASALVEMPWRYVQTLREKGAWGRDLVIENLNELYQRDEDRHLLRFAKTGSNRHEVRGFLSDKYRRLDARPITEALTKSLAATGALPYEGVATDTRVALRAILPKLYEPVENEIIAFGLDYQTSDYGDGALTVGLFMLRMWCTNLASGTDMLRQVHLGKRLADDLEFSAETYKLDTQTMASAVGDIVGNVLSSKTIEGYNLAIKAAHEEKVDGRAVAEKLKKIGLTKAEVEEATGAFNSPEIEVVPAGSNVWRMSNAISWVAGKTEDKRRQIELQRLAGSVIALPKAA